MRLLAEDVRKNDGLISVLSNRKGIKTKVGKRFLSRRYNLVPLLRSRPGGIPRELAVRDLPISRSSEEAMLPCFLKSDCKGNTFC